MHQLMGVDSRRLDGIPMGDQFKISRVSGASASNDELLGDLRRIAEERGIHTVPLMIYRETGRFADTTISRRFGSWNKALLAAGLDTSNQLNIDDERLFENLFNLWQHYGRQPRRSELAHSPSTISQSPYLRRFGSWGQALQQFVDYANGEEALAPPPATRSYQQHRTGRDPSLRLRFQVLQRDHFKCRQCGASPATTAGVELHIDHIMPWSKGGETTPDNLQTLCSKCNLVKSNLIPQS